MFKLWTSKSELTVFPKAYQSYQLEKDPWDPSVSPCLPTSEPSGIYSNTYSQFHKENESAKNQTKTKEITKCKNNINNMNYESTFCNRPDR